MLRWYTLPSEKLIMPAVLSMPFHSGPSALSQERA